MYLISCLGIVFTSGLVYLINDTNTVVNDKFSGFHQEQFDLPYNLASPDTFYLMPKELKEISGLSFLEPDKVLTINDEKANLYTYDFTKEEIVSKIDFGKSGDYESITRRGSTVYIAESNGNIKVIDLEKGEKVDEYDPPLSSRNNVEGLCYDATNNQLLIACKGQLEKKGKSNQLKGIYRFNLENNELNKEPYKIIDIKEESKTLKPLNLTNDRLSQLSINSRLKSFAPSGIAINPISLNTYIISFRGGILTVLDPAKNVLGIYFLAKSIYGQPEGITFNKEGDLYISNEARSTTANILKIKRRKI